MRFNCLRFLEMVSFKEIDRMTIPEYQLRMKAYQLKRVDHMYDIHMQAWANNMASQRRKNGRPVYRRFEQFFDYKRAVKLALGEIKQSSTEKLRNFIANFNSKKGG